MADTPIVDQNIDQKIILAHKEPARERFNPYTELKVGQTVAMRIFVDGKEVGGWKYTQAQPEAKDKMRVYVAVLDTAVVSKPSEAQQMEP